MPPERSLRTIPELLAKVELLAATIRGSVEQMDPDRVDKPTIAYIWAEISFAEERLQAALDQAATQS